MLPAHNLHRENVMGRLTQRAKNAPAAQVSEAERAFTASVAELEATSEHDRATPNVDLQDAGLATIALVERVARPELTERIAKQVKAGEFDENTLDSARQIAWASVHIRRKLILRTETQSEAKVPKALADESAQLVERMRRVCEYHFDDDATLGPVLAHLRLGSGYLDRANDLEEYAAIYREHHAVVSGDRKHYRAGDEALARKLSEELYRALGVASSEGERDWNALQSAAWPRLLSLYNQLRRIGMFLSGGDESDWPTLVTAARANARKSATPAPEPAPTPAPA